MSDEVALAATDQPLPVAVRRITDERVPEGMVGLGSFLEDRLIARCAVPADLAAMIEEQELFGQPVKLVLAARAADPGLQCRLFAVIDVPGAGEEAQREPWADSVPGAAFDAPDEEEPTQAMVFLGQVVRFDKDRKHRDSLALEAVDILRRIVQGRAVEVVDKVLEDLLGSDDFPG